MLHGATFKEKIIKIICAYKVDKAIFRYMFRQCW